MENKIEWGDYSNVEIEVKLKTLEFEYEKTKKDISNLYNNLNALNKSYLEGKDVLEKRLNPKKNK